MQSERERERERSDNAHQLKKCGGEDGVYLCDARYGFLVREILYIVYVVGG